MLLTIIFLLPILFVHSIYGAPVEPEPRTPIISDKFGVRERKLLEKAFEDVTLLAEGILYWDWEIVGKVYSQYFDEDDVSTVFSE